MIGHWSRQGFSPISINSGSCSSFAKRLEQIFPDGQAIWGNHCAHSFKSNVETEGHCFFYYKQKYYDAESPKGEIFPDDLQYYRRAKKYFRKTA